MSQLRMIYLVDDSVPIPEPVVPEGFRLRNMGKEELAPYSDLRVSASFNQWQESDYDDLAVRLVDGRNGHFVIEEIATGNLVAAADGEYLETELIHGMGTLGWVMSSPLYRGKKLGYSVCAAVMQHLAKHGFRTFQLSTDDFRVPAIKTYLNLGWRPWLYEADMESRWRALAEIFGRSFESLNALPLHFDYIPKNCR